MKIIFDCSKDCKHVNICKYFNAMKELDDSIKSIDPEGHDYVTIHIKCKHYIGIWGGIRDGK